MKALELAANGKVTEYIVPSFKKIDSFLKEWNIDIKDQREVFLAIAKVLRENKRYCNNVSSSLICFGIPMSSWDFYSIFQFGERIPSVCDKIFGNFLQ